MIEVGTLPTVVQALLIVVAVFLEAVVLYGGYGYLEEWFAPRISTVIENV